MINSRIDFIHFYIDRLFDVWFFILGFFSNVLKLVIRSSTDYKLTKILYLVVVWNRTINFIDWLIECILFQNILYRPQHEDHPVGGPQDIKPSDSWTGRLFPFILSFFPPFFVLQQIAAESFCSTSILFFLIIAQLPQILNNRRFLLIAQLT